MPTSHANLGKTHLPWDPAATSFLRKCPPHTRQGQYPHRRKWCIQGRPPKGYRPGPRDMEHVWRHSGSSPLGEEVRLSSAGKRPAMSLNILQRAGLRNMGRQGPCVEVGACWRPSSQRVKQPTAQAAFLPARPPAGKDCIKPGQEMGCCLLVRISGALLGNVPSGGLPSLPAPTTLRPDSKENTRIHI